MLIDNVWKYCKEGYTGVGQSPAGCLKRSRTQEWPPPTEILGTCHDYFGVLKMMVAHLLKEDSKYIITIYDSGRPLNPYI